VKDDIWRVVKILPTDYVEYGGSIKRWEHDDRTYPDCSVGCKYFQDILFNNGDISGDWGVCWNPSSPRYGLLTWEHQAGFLCFEQKN
jgi:hypothetical protein